MKVYSNRKPNFKKVSPCSAFDNNTAKHHGSFHEFVGADNSSLDSIYNHKGRLVPIGHTKTHVGVKV